MVKVAQCWDDGVVTDLTVIEICRKYNAKATFNLCPSQFQPERKQPGWRSGKESGWSYKGFYGGRMGLNELKEVYQGFKVASHCWNHEKAGLIPDDQFLKAAVDGKKFLEDTFQQDCPGFAWPCGLHTPETEKLLAEAGFTYGRTTKYTDDVLNDNANPLALKSNCHYQDHGFWDKFEKAKAANGVFYFWGHSYEMMQYDKLIEQYEMRVRLLSEDPEVEWVDVADIVPLLKNKTC